jgi:hypothetical protein
MINPANLAEVLKQYRARQQADAARRTAAAREGGRPGR